MNHFTFSGTDASLEISLLEYGLIISDQKHEDGSGTQFVVYKIGENQFGCGHFSEEETNGYIDGKEFMDDKDIKEFLSFVGAFAEGWKELSHANKLCDLIQYYGSENICGTEYSPMTEAEVKERYL